MTESISDSAGWRQQTSSIHACAWPTSRCFPKYGRYIPGIAPPAGSPCNQMFQCSTHLPVWTIHFSCSLITSIVFVVLGMVLIGSAFPTRRPGRFRGFTRQRRPPFIRFPFLFSRWWVRRAWGHLNKGRRWSGLFVGCLKKRLCHKTWPHKRRYFSDWVMRTVNDGVLPRFHERCRLKCYDLAKLSVFMFVTSLTTSRAKTSRKIFQPLIR